MREQKNDSLARDRTESAGAEALRCRICSAMHSGELIPSPEMMFGTREMFDYFACSACHTLQIAHIPEDLGRYYSSTQYYSFNNTAASENPLKRWLKSAAASAMVGRPERYPRGTGPLDRMGRGAEPWIAVVPGMTKASAILDVGCGEGARLKSLASLGFRNLTGIDPFLPDELAGRTASGVRLLKGELETREETFDCVMFHHSLEHVPDPGETLRIAARRLNPGGVILVRIPLFQPGIWGRFGTDWAQMDPPRHLYLFAPQGFIEFARRNSFETLVHGYDMLGWPLAWSEAYRRGIPMFTDGKPNALPFERAKLDEFEAEARALNASGGADQGFFVLKPL